MTSDEKALERLQRDTNYFNEPEQPNPFRPKAEPPICQHLMVKGEPCHLCEPKASPSLEDAAYAFYEQWDKERTWGTRKCLAEFARQQRRDAVAEFVREFKEQYPGLVYAIEAVAKEMNDE